MTVGSLRRSRDPRGRAAGSPLIQRRCRSTLLCVASRRGPMLQQMDPWNLGACEPVALADVAVGDDHYASHVALTGTRASTAGLFLNFMLGKFSIPTTGG
jgi:hypothetical protein